MCSILARRPLSKNSKASFELIIAISLVVKLSFPDFLTQHDVFVFQRYDVIFSREYLFVKLCRLLTELALFLPFILNLRLEFTNQLLGLFYL